MHGAGLLFLILSLFIRTAILALIFTIIGMFILKFFYRQFPLKVLAWVCFWASFRVLLIGFILYVAGSLTGAWMPTGASGLVTFVGMCIIGWLISHDMQKRGVPKAFPGPGFKVVIGLVIVSWLFVGIGFLIYALT